MKNLLSLIIIIINFFRLQARIEKREINRVMLDRVRIGSKKKNQASKVAATTAQNVAAQAELAAPDNNKKLRTIPCTIIFLNDTQQTFQLEVSLWLRNDNLND